MRKSRFTDSQILAFSKQNEEGAKVPDLCRLHGFSSAQCYKWRSMFGGMDASLMKNMKALEEENRWFKNVCRRRDQIRYSGGNYKKALTVSQRKGVAREYVDETEISISLTCQ